MLKACAYKISCFCDFLNTPGDLLLQGRSPRLIADTFKLASVAYYQILGTSLIDDAAYDKLHVWMNNNIAWLRKHSIIPDVIAREQIEPATGMGVTLTSATDWDVLYYLVLLRGNISGEDLRNVEISIADKREQFFADKDKEPKKLRKRLRRF